MLGGSGWVAVGGAEQALHPLLLGAPGGPLLCALTVGLVRGVESATNRLAVDVVLDGEFGDQLTGALPAADGLDLLLAELGFRWHSHILLRGTFRETFRGTVQAAQRR